MFAELKELFLDKRVAQVLLEWQGANRLGFLVSCICAELVVQWIWFTLVWFNQDTFGQWINFDVMGVLWLLCGQMALFFMWVLGYIIYKRSTQENFKYLQSAVSLAYIIYMSCIYLTIGLMNIFVGVTLVSATIMGVMLLWREMMWSSFIFHLFILLGLTLLSILGIDVPSIYQDSHLKIGSVITSGLNTATAFWYLSFLFWSLPKATLSIYLAMNLMAETEVQLEEAQYFATYDELTKVKNRRFIMKHLYNVLFLAEPDWQRVFDIENRPQALSIILLDIDYFKSINDTHGHLSGDMVLVEVARRLAKTMQEAGWEISRYGGEEFLAVLPQVTHVEAMQIAGKIHQIISTDAYRIIDGMTINVTASFGVASFSHEEVSAMRVQYHFNKQNDTTQSLIANQPITRIIDDDLDEDYVQPISASAEDLIIESLISMADSALYDAKRLGRNRIVSANHYVDESESRSYIERSQNKAEEILAKVPIVQA